MSRGYGGDENRVPVGRKPTHKSRGKMFVFQGTKKNLIGTHSAGGGRGEIRLEKKAGVIS